MRGGEHSEVGAEVKYTLALILAGGRGKRLAGLTRWRVKPAVPFGGRFRIIDFALSNCINSGLRKIGVLTQYKSQSLIRHIRRGWGLLHPELGEFIEILPAQQRLAEKWYSGTADAVYQNIDIIQRYNPEYVIILAGDHVYKMDYGPMIAAHAQRDADLTICCLEVPLSEASRYGVVQVGEDSRIISFEEKPAYPRPSPDDPETAMVSMGIYVMRTSLLFDLLIEDAGDENSTHDFGHDIIPSIIDSNEVYAHNFWAIGGGRYWRDVGTVDAFWKANMELVGVTPELNLYDRHWSIRTNSRQYPPAKFVFNDEGRRGVATDSLVTNGSIVSGGLVDGSLLSFDVRVEEGAEVRESVVLPNVVIGPEARIRKAVIDKGCRIPEGMVIGEDMETDASRFYVSEGGVTLVTPDMLGQPYHLTD